MSASIFAAAGSAVKFLAAEVCRVKFDFVKFQILRPKFHDAEFSMRSRNTKFAKLIQIAKF